MPTAKRRATYADLAEVPEHRVAELIDGELVTSPRPASRHALAAAAMAADLVGSFGRPPGGRRAPGGWWILIEPELHLGADVLVPDLAGWRRERMPAFPDVPAFELAPDWVCEVVSPATVHFDRGRKLAVYARERVARLWLVDPLARRLEVYHLEEGQWLLTRTHSDRETVRAEPFHSLGLDLRRWWGEV